MENQTKNYFKFKLIQKHLIIIFIVILCISCEKDKPTINYNFQDYSFTEATECYDTAGNKFDSLSYMFSEDEFIYNDEFYIPYENIEIIEDNSFIINYVSEGKSETRKGVIDHKNDSVYFYVDKVSPYNLLLKGIFINSQLRIAGCGYIYYIYIEDAITYESVNKTTSLHIPEITSLLDDFPNPSVNGNYGNKYLYFQKFDLIYEKTSE
jgi:hypothetical protein